MNYNYPWIKEITYETLPNEDLQIVASVLGFETAIKMMFEMAGSTISVPKAGPLKAKTNYILKHYDGTKHSRFNLAQACNVTEGYVYKVIRENIKKLP